MRLIDADALVEKAYWHGEHPDVGNPFADGVEAVDMSDIDNAPTIEVKNLVEYHMDELSRTIHYRVVEAEPVRHSFWEAYSTSAYGGYKDGEVRWLPRKFYRCERCRKGSAIRSNYCPNCGAKMDVTDINVGNKGGDSHDQA